MLGNDPIVSIYAGEQVDLRDLQVGFSRANPFVMRMRELGTRSQR
jgi:hypothetical protein